MTALLREAGHDVVAAPATAAELLDVVDRERLDLAIVDIRLPPTFRDEGIRAAITTRQRAPGLGVLILSQYVEPVYTAELLDSGPGGIGYLLKERVGDVREFLEAAQRVATGGTALDREVVTHLLRERSRGGGGFNTLTPRERETLALMAEGRSNTAIARALVVTLGAVEKNVSNIFAKLDLLATDDDNRRVLAVLTYLRATA